MSRTVNLIVIHCSASPDGVSLFEGKAGEPNFCTPVQVIDRWHQARGFRRSLQARELLNGSLGSIGYHFVIYTSGAIATGRALEEVGAHVLGNNLTSIGVCMIGTERFTKEQWASLAFLVKSLRSAYPGSRVCGHRDLSPDQNNDGLVQPWEWLKTCPGFDVATWLAQGVPRDEDVFTPPAPEKAAA